jgi:putative aldouronate transport system substrate-binding protein
MKKNEKRRLAAFGGIAVIALVAAAGCSSNEASSGGTTDSSSNSSGKSSSGDKTVTFQIMRQFGSPEYPADGGEGRVEVLKALEKMGVRGIDFRSTVLSGDEYNTKLNLLAASGQLPDYFDIDPKTLQRFVDQGLIQPIDNYLKKSPHIMKVVPPEYWKQVTFNGKIYAIPNGTRTEPFNFPTVDGFNVRTDWLDALKLKQPTNLNELHDVLKAFVTQDPDKNGKNDTIGLGAAKDSSFAGIFGAFGIQPTFWTERGGQLKKGLVLPEMKQALTLLQTWYKEGLIDHDFPIMDAKQKDEKVANSLAGVWHGSGYYTDKSGSNTAEALYKASPNAKVAVLEAPLGPDGKRGYAEANAYAASPLRALSHKAQDPEKLFQLLDWMASDEPGGGANYITYGVEGKDYTFDKATNSIIQSTTYSDLYKRGFSNPIRFILITDRRWTQVPVREGINVVNKYLIKNAMWNTLPAESDYPDLEKKLYAEYFVKIVTGTWAVDKYDEFIQKYYEQGGREIEKQANDLYKKLK